MKRCLLLPPKFLGLIGLPSYPEILGWLLSLDWRREPEQDRGLSGGGGCVPADPKAGCGQLCPLLSLIAPSHLC